MDAYRTEGIVFVNTYIQATLNSLTNDFDKSVFRLDHLQVCKRNIFQALVRALILYEIILNP